MRIRLKQMVCVVLAAYMLCVSGGVNVYHYCCDACRSYGHDIFTTITCEEVHLHHHCSEQGCGHGHCAQAVHAHDDLCSHLTQTAKHCDVHHIEAPQLSADNGADVVPEAMVMDAIPAAVAVVDMPVVERGICLCILSNAPPVRGGRVVIALKNSYLI